MTRNTTEPAIELPAGVEAAVRATADRVAPLPADLAVVRARARIIRRRRTALRAVAAAGVAVALGASLPAVWARVAPDDTIVGGPVGHPIGLWLNRDKPPVTEGLPPGNHVAGSSGEITAQLRTVAGKPTVVPVGVQPGLSDAVYMGPAPLPGGGLATIGFAQGPSKGSFGKELIVVADADGRTVSSRPYPSTGTVAPRTMPMTGSGTTLFWWSFRQTRDTTRPVLLTYDIAGGRLRELTPAVGGNGYELPYFGMQATSTRIVSWPAVSGPTCSADIEDATTGERLSTLRPAVTGCTDVYFALSPDDERVAALVTFRDAATWSQRVITVDAHTGRIQKEFGTPVLASGTDRTKLVSGIDWTDGKTLRYARGVLPGTGRAGPDPILLTFKL